MGTDPLVLPGPRAALWTSGRMGSLCAAVGPDGLLGEPLDQVAVPVRHAASVAEAAQSVAGLESAGDNGR